MAALKVYLDEQLARVSGKMPVAKAIRYMLKHWDGLCVFLTDGRLETRQQHHRARHRARGDSAFIVPPFFKYLETLKSASRNWDDTGILSAERRQ